MFLDFKLKNNKLNDMTLSQRLFTYMLLMFLVLVIVVVIGSLAFGKFPLAQKELKETLGIQMLSFEKDISTNMEALASNGFLLSKNLSTSIDSMAESRGKSFSSMVESQQDVIALTDYLYDTLHESMMQSNCTGAFFFLETGENDPDSTARPGIYLNNFNNISDKNNILLFRGSPSIAEAHNISLHRKWRKDFNTERVSDYEEITSLPAEKLSSFYRFSKPIVLAGTYNKVLLLIIPIVGNDDTLYGACGFELSASYFKHHFMQPTTLEYLSCSMSVYEDNTIKTLSGFSTGVLDGNYTPLYENFEVKDISDSLITFKGSHTALHGLIKPIQLSEDSPKMALTVAVPEEYYNNLVFKSRITTVALLLLLIFFAVICSIILSRKFMNPISDAFLFLKTRNTDAKKYNIKELDDLIEHISANDDNFNTQYSELVAKQEENERKLLEVNEQLRQLAEEKGKSITKDEYDLFKENISKLTPKETEIFNLYARGLTANEIIEIQGFSKNALKYHNKNIYSKLGVSGRKELLQYVVVLNYSDTK